jgi:hypothetical protein
MPDPFAGSVGIISFDGVGQRHRSRSEGEVAFVLSQHPREVASQAVHLGVGQDGTAVLLPLPSSNCDFAPFEVDVLDTELKGLEETQASPVQEGADQPDRIAELAHQRSDFLAREDDRQSSAARVRTCVAALDLTYEANANTTFRYCPSVNPAGSG